MFKPLAGNLQDLAYKYFLVTSEKQFKRLTKKLGIYDSSYMPSGALACCSIYEEQGIAIVCLKEEAAPEEIISLLIHEAVHLWQAHCRWIGEDKPGDETEAYAIQKIASELIREYGKSKLSVIKLAEEGVSRHNALQDCSSGTQVREEPVVSHLSFDRRPELS